MAVRTSMSDLITQLRLMVDDKNAVEFTDQELQDVLDQRAYIAEYEEMIAIASIENSVTVYKEFESEHRYYEADTILTDSAWATLTPDTTDFKLAYFTFNTAQGLPVLIYGWWYDMNAAAGDVWDLKANKYATQFDFSADGGSYKLSQKTDAARKLAAAYRSQSITASQMGVI